MKYAVLDFETTGGQTTDEIIQVGLVLIDEDNIVKRYSSLVKPNQSIPPFITSLTGIDDAAVQGAPSLEEVMMEMQPLLYDTALVAHNAGFDFAFLQRALDACGYMPFSGPVLDTMDMLTILFPSLSSLQLGNVCHELEVEHARPHQADSDAEATALIWLKCLQKLNRLPLLVLQRITALFENDYSNNDLAWFLQEMLERKEASVSLDEDSYKYYRQFAMNVDDWGDDEPVRSEEDRAALQVSFDEFYDGLKQRMKEKFDFYEEREAQSRMLKEVASSFDTDRHLMIEAGTGTGKSLGYLIPSLYHGIREDKKVLISTHTINLQEQLRTRDIPVLQEIFPVPFQAAVLKGRSHYLCLRKFENKIQLQDFNFAKEERLTAAQMIVWLSESERGDEEELHLTGRGAEFWRTVESDADSCLNRACPWFKKCFYHRARNDANKADVVITNHSLLFTDIKADHRLLPSYKHLVIDEAHHLEEVASKHMGIELKYMSFVNTLTRLFRDSKNGQLPSLRIRLQGLGGELPEHSAEWDALIEGIYPKLVEVKEHWDHLAELLYELVNGKMGESGETGQLVFRIKDDQMPKQWDKLLTIEDNIYIGLGEISRKLDRLAQELKDWQEEHDLKGSLTDLAGSVKELNRQRDALRFFMKRSDPDYVYWLEASPQFKMRSLHLFSVPTDVSKILQQSLFDEKDSVILTSATLSVDKTFDYSRDQLGLGRSDKLNTVLLPSPFNYRKQALVCIPRDFPGIKGRDGEDYFVHKLVESLHEVAVETRGRMLVLFTSYRMLKNAYPELKERLASAGIQVLGQGIDSFNRSKLTRLFQESESAVLLGTSSFWEGVDIPGEALTCLAIVRLPFQPPNHPVTEAKSEQLKKSNLNPFMKLSVPQAVIRFKQGFGRLVRRASDKGIVILYDTRVIDTQYGKYFLYSLPGPKIEHMPTGQMVPRIKQWMEEEHA
ncbi:Probable ATP-dependent helicase dinG homolog [Chlamydia abortus]|uniref:3'-5' exonuclease DinG n=1 Tax=Paenibacillus residui TaxID=629724 RepID=A0ABW3D540_9BACL|nr:MULTISPECIES: ATP-dependent DNA helicase DinG [Paenibacillaceae]SHE10992.1 Probable ATP-dependent helicase dinG homolog [Chlamydia abortus]